MMKKYLFSILFLAVLTSGYILFKKLPTKDTELLPEKKQWKEGDKRNYGIPCGPVNGVLVLDIDNMELFRASGNRESPPTFTVKTAKGFHLYYKYPKANGSVYKNIGNQSCGYDIRGCGGQVVGPGSVHVDTGVIYEVYRDLPLTDPPQWMLDETREKENEPADIKVIKERILSNKGGGRAGDIFNQENNVRELIIEAGWKPLSRTTSLRDGTHVEHFTRPGKRGGVSGSVIDGRYFYSFSTDCAPFEPERAYDAFGVYTFLKHNGDFKAAAKKVSAIKKAVSGMDDNAIPF